MKTALIFGASGLIGSELLKVITQNNNYNHIKLFVRSEQINNNPKVEIIQTDFTYLEKHKNLITGNDCFFCIGTTKRDTPDKNEYRRIEQTIPINVGKIAKINSVESFVYVSSIGANSSSSSLYLKNKGLVEEKLNNLNYFDINEINSKIRKVTADKLRNMILRAMYNPRTELGKIMFQKRLEIDGLDSIHLVWV